MKKQAIKTVKTAKAVTERKAKAIRVPPRKRKKLAVNKGIIKNTTISIPDIVSIPLLKKEKDVIKTPANLRIKERLENLRIWTPGGFSYFNGLTRRETIKELQNDNG